jgi:hypothetical protein
MKYFKTKVYFFVILLINFSNQIYPEKINIRYPISDNNHINTSKNLELKKIIHQIQNEREAYYKLQKEWAEEKSNYSNDEKVMNTEIKYFKTILEKELKHKNKLKNSLAALEQDLKGKGIMNKLYIPILWNVVDSLKNIIVGGLPFKLNERLEKLNTAKNFISDPAKTIGEKYRKIWDLCIIEMNYAETSEVYNDTIEINGKIKVVNILRLGTIGLYYRAGKDYGMLVKEKMKYKWHIMSNSEEIKNIEVAFSIVNKQKPPVLISLPVLTYK